MAKKEDPLPVRPSSDQRAEIYQSMAGLRRARALVRQNGKSTRLFGKRDDSMSGRDAIVTEDDAGPSYEQLQQILRARADLKRIYAKGWRENSDDIPPTVDAVLKKLRNAV